MSIDLNDQEVKDAIAAAVAEEVKGLKAKNSELTDLLKKARKGQEIDPETVAELERTVEDLQGKLTEATKTAKAATTEAEKAKKALSDEVGVVQNLLLDNGLTDELVKGGVTNPVLQKALKSMLKGQLQVVADGDKRVVKAGDKDLSAFVTEYLNSADGAHFKAAPANSGGGAGGGGGKGNNTPASLAEAKTPQERKAVIAARLEAANKAAAGA